MTAQDVVRGLQRICNPASPSGGLTYYEDTIAGFTQFCDGFAKVNAADPAAMASYMNGHQISGVTTPDASTVVINLTQPASDFLNILALPFASAAPVEYLKYVPDGAAFRQHTLSDGPYAITTYQPGQQHRPGPEPGLDPGVRPVAAPARDHHRDHPGTGLGPGGAAAAAGRAPPT